MEVPAASPNEKIAREVQQSAKKVREDSLKRIAPEKYVDGKLTKFMQEVSGPLYTAGNFGPNTAMQVLVKGNKLIEATPDQENVLAVCQTLHGFFARAIEENGGTLPENLAHMMKLSISKTLPRDLSPTMHQKKVDQVAAAIMKAKPNANPKEVMDTVDLVARNIELMQLDETEAEEEDFIQSELGRRTRSSASATTTVNVLGPVNRINEITLALDLGEHKAKWVHNHMTAFFDALGEESYYDGKAHVKFHDADRIIIVNLWSGIFGTAGTDHFRAAVTQLFKGESEDLGEKMRAISASLKYKTKSPEFAKAMGYWAAAPENIVRPVGKEVTVVRGSVASAMLYQSYHHSLDVFMGRDRSTLNPAAKASATKNARREASKILGDRYHLTELAFKESWAATLGIDPSRVTAKLYAAQVYHEMRAFSPAMILFISARHVTV